MKKTALLALALAGVSGPSMARAHHHHQVYRHRPDHHVYADRHRSDDHADAKKAEEPAGGKESATTARAHITCDMVRAYVAQVGLTQARAFALSAGMTAAEERRAKRCLQNGA